jgi:hypothetical protein
MPDANIINLLIYAHYKRYELVKVPDLVPVPMPDHGGNQMS